ncbi:glutathione S-transferase family protein [Salipiger sp. 1_MG-2023]|uniref:glutathione S-transferase family protein n=1 Tax=Salipiger sp. 1_MG-2023 TaxID=3062665 RepID=UPI0026E41E3C|nr:glutathione S-transferase family protein [Salipiger sp. 1_MG-2023]MDO6585209.1 glutathione S-transferase family protein [Salipiger sp. 1_MG-2023]
MSDPTRNAPGLTLIGRKTSINVQKVRWLLLELGQDHAHEELGGAFGGLQTDEFAALNPNRLVPVLIDGDLVLWESNAILRYLARRYSPGGIEGANPAQIAQADMWMEWFQNRPLPQLTTLFYQTVRLPLAERDAGLRDAAAARLNEAYSLLDRHLDGRDFLVGDTLSLGDIVVGTSLFRYFTLAFERPALPALETYYDRLQTRAAYRKGAMVSFESLRAKES